MRKFVFWILLLNFLFFSGCKAFEPDLTIPSPLTIPENFSIDTVSNENEKEWQLAFDNDELNILITNALDNNFNIKVLKAKIDQVKAKVEKEKASFWPDLGFSFGGQKKRTQVKTENSDTVHDYSHSWDGSLSGSYVADIWGEAKASKQTQVSDLQAAEQELKETVLDLTADIAETWINIIATRQKRSILNNQIKINKSLLELQKLRYINGKANALDVSQQQEALAEANSQIPSLEKQEQILLNNLAFLSGKTTVNTIKMNTVILPELISFPDIGIPSDLLNNRPDIQAARMRLFSSQWRITAAKADLLPSFKLSAQALFSSGELNLLFQNWVGTLAASLAGPIFDGGLRRAEVKRAKAAAKEQLNLYAMTIAKAIFEVEDSIVSIQKQKDYIKLLLEELRLTRFTLKDAMIQYQNGKSSYLAYLTAWTNVERLERQLIGEKAEVIKEHIKLYNALGLKPVK